MARRGMEHRKPKAVSSKLDPDKLAAFLKKYENLQNTIGDDEAVLFGDAVHPTHPTHPTHAVRPVGGAAKGSTCSSTWNGCVGCWGPKEVQIAVPQSSGRQRLNLHGAVDLETGKTRMIGLGAGSRCISSRPTAALDPIERLWGLIAQACHAQSVSCNLCRFQSGGSHVSR
jgi:hypothetical protein